MVLASEARNMVRIGKPRMAPALRTITKHYHRPDKYSYYAHLLSILDRDVMPIGSGTIHTEQIPHTEVKPIDYIGLYLIVIASSMATINILYRLYY